MIKTTPWTGGTDEEYETQHFGFDAKRLQLSTRRMVEHTIISHIKQMELKLQKELPTNETDKNTLTHACDKLIRMYCERTEPHLKVIDSEIEKMFKVPSHLILPEDEVQLNQVKDEEYENLKTEVDNLRKRVKRAALMDSLLSDELQEIASVSSVYDIAKKDMEVLDLIEKDLVNHEKLKNIQEATDSMSDIVSVLSKMNVFKCK